MYYERLSLLLDEAFEQINMIVEATSLVEGFFDGDELGAGVTRDEDEALPD